MYSLVRDLFVSVIAFVLLATSSVLWAQVRNSASYQMERDSLSTGGGAGTSSSYALNSTVGEVATGRSTSSSYILSAGFQQQPEVTLALGGGAPVVMAPDIGGVSGGLSFGSSTLNASTDGAAGYQLTIRSSSSPAMQSGVNTIADYAPAGAAADTTFLTTATDAHFGYSPYGPDITNRFRSDGATCGSGSASTTACWDGLSTSAQAIASAAGANAPAGASTTIYFRVGVGGSVTQPPGVYIATTTVTLTSL